MNEASSVVAAAIERLTCILGLSRLTFDSPTDHPSDVTDGAFASDIQAIMTTLRSFIASNPPMLPAPHAAKAYHPFEKDRGATRHLRKGIEEGSHLPRDVCTLPSRMMEAFGRPDSRHDFLASLSAIEALFECCEISYRSEDSSIAWWGMSEWLIPIPDQFDQLIIRKDPAALVVLTHWSALLLKRAEQLGCWYLGGLSDMLVTSIKKQLKHEGRVTSLIEDLVDR